MVKQVDYDKYIEMIQSNKFDNVINSLRTDIADYIVNVLKMKDKTDTYFDLNIEKSINNSNLASFSFATISTDNFSKPHQKVLTVNKQFLVNCGLLGRKDVLIDTIKHELVHFYVAQTISPKDAADGEFAFEMALKKYDAPSSNATPEEKRFTRVVSAPTYSTLYATDIGEVIPVPFIGPKSLYNIAIGDKHYKYLEARKVIIEME